MCWTASPGCRAEADIVLVEGAGSASEVNLRAGDIANMGFARATGTPVVVVGDIDRGGVIASLVGTHAVLDPADAAMVRGFVVNRMRGDLTLFDAGMALIAARTGWAPLGLVPHFPGAARLPAEDAADLGPGAAPARRHAAHRCARAAADQQLRRPGPAAGRAWSPGADGAAGPAAAGVRAGAAARLQGDGRRPAGLPRCRLGRRPGGAPAPGRAGAGGVRRLPDARHADRGPRRHRGAGRRGARAWPCWTWLRC